MKNIVIIAPPAGGKGTIAKRLVENEGYIHISTGDMLRSIDKTTELGKKIDSLISNGKFVPDEIVFDLLKTKLSNLGEAPFILDGIPRNISQIKLLDDTLKSLNSDLDLVIYINVPYDVLVKRATGRESCPTCGSIYNKYTNAPMKEGVCDKCGSSLTTREDDSLEVYEERYKTYMKKTSPVVDYYRNLGMLHEVDGAINAYESVINLIHDKY